MFVQKIKFINNFFFTALYLFIKDKLSIRANAIVYSIIVAIIPLLTVLIRIANINQQQLLETINRIFVIYGIIGIQPIIDIIQDILSRSKDISGVSFLFLIYASLNIFKHLEESANQVFRVPSRGFLIRTSIYTSWLIFLPLVVLFLMDVSTKINNFFTVSNYISIKHTPKLFFLLDDKFKIHKFDNEFNYLETIDYVKKTDFLVLNRKVIVNNDEYDYDLTGDSLKAFLSKPKILELQNDFILIACNPNIIFYSSDLGTNWDFRYFIYSDKGKTFQIPFIEDIAIVQNQIYVLLTLGKQTYLLVLDKNYFDVKEKFLFDDFYNKIYFYDDKIFLSGQGNLQFSNLNSWNWGILDVPQINTTFHYVYISDKFNTFLSATNRVIVYEKGKISYPIVRINQLNQIKSMKIFNDGKGFLFAEKDLRFTLNYGKDWHIAKIYDESEKPVPFFPLIDVSRVDNNFYFVGINKSIYVAQISSITIDPQTDLPLIKLKIQFKQEASKTRITLPIIISLILNFIYLVLILSFFYKILPNKNITYKSAFVGGFLVSIIYILFVSFFRYMIPFFGSSHLIYGIWFAVPVSLLILLILVNIFLFGLEITRLMMNPSLVSDKIWKKFKNL